MLRGRRGRDRSLPLGYPGRPRSHLRTARRHLRLVHTESVLSDLYSRLAVTATRRVECLHQSSKSTGASPRPEEPLNAGPIHPRLAI